MPEVASLSLARLTSLVLVAPLVQGLQGLILGKSVSSADVTPHFLTPTDVGNISAADCIKARKRDRTIICGNFSAAESTFVGPISPVNYPHYSDPVCHSEGGFLCDPGTDVTSMTSTQRRNLTQLMVGLRNQDDSLVVCGHLQHDAVDSWHYQPFYLGIAVLPNWPAVSSSADMLQNMGELIMADWNMDELYVGEPQPFLRCPTTALLVLSPLSGEAFLSSPSCDFICASKGGGEVAARARSALRAEGPEDLRAYRAAVAGAEEVYRQLAARHFNSSATAAPMAVHEELNISNFLQRFCFGIAVFALGAAGLLGAAVLLLGPGLIARRGKFEC